MGKNLVIVESPAKAKTIEKFLGKDYAVKSSFGHVRDLPSKGMSVEIDNNFKPEYKVSPDKTKVVAELRKAAKASDTVWLASDEDREGEAIAWHLSEVLKLPAAKTKRIVFHEITKSAIDNAVKNPRKVDRNLVDAQQARRILDRLVGYELSPVLWKKVRKGLSAGRVQSVAVRLIVEREREIEEHSSSSQFKVTAEFKSGKHRFEAELTERLDTIDDAKKLLKSLKSDSFTITSVEKKPGKKSPPPPFTTSSLQQSASRLGFSVKQTMMLAQRLYESGSITYMRTDSLNLSEEAIAAAEKHIKAEYGDTYSSPRRFKTKSTGAQEAHEAIRPTNLAKPEAGADAQQKKLYNLIRNRTIASQMSDAQIQKTIIDIASSKGSTFKAEGEVITFDGFLKVIGKTDETELPDVTKDTAVDLKSALATEVFSRPPARYTEASLVKKLEEMGIGRPSTYAPTISTVQDRGYVVKGTSEGEPRIVRQLTLEKGTVTASEKEEKTGADKNKLLPTDVAQVVTDFLVKHFEHVIDYDFTREVEAQFDHIAHGKEDWEKMIAKFYKPFHKTVEAAENVSRTEVSQARSLGTDPKTGKMVYARFGRYGPMVQLGEAGKDVDDDAEKPKFAPMPAGKKVETVTLEEALEMFKLPRKVGKTPEGEEITANIGRFGPYVKVGSLFVSIKPEDPMHIKLDKALELIAAKKKQEKEKNIAEFEGGIKVLNGRYGPYVTDGKKNAPVPKDTDPKKIDLAAAQKILEEAKSKPRFARRKKS